MIEASNNSLNIGRFKLKDHDRPELDQVLSNIAKQMAHRSTCKHRQIGAILTTPEGQILASGYNGAPSGSPHCTDIGCLREGLDSGTHHELCRAVHAEQNCIIQAAKMGTKVDGSWLYCTNQPCILCAKMLINLHIARVVYLYEYPDTRSLDMLEAAGIKVVHYK